MSVLVVGRFDGKGDKYEVHVFMILCDIYNTFTSVSIFHTQYYGIGYVLSISIARACVYVRVRE